MIKAILFDIDGVLIDSLEATRRFYQELLTKNGYAAPTREEYQDKFPLTMMDTIKFFTKSHDEQELKKIFDMGANSKENYHFELISSPIHMKETIRELSQNYTLGIVTSRIRDIIFEIPQLKEIEHCFQTIITPADTTKHKPDPEPLLLMLERLHISADEAVYVWDAESDLQAAQAAGIQFILFPKREMEWVIYSVDHFEGLPEMIKKLQTQKK